jgi:DNA polymerase III delta prime subunit
MHAFLLVGNNLEEDIKKLSKKLNAKILPYPLAKIEDVRNLNNLIRLSFDSPTLIVSENIHETGTEALNAFLKNLEEPQENIYFALTAPSVRKVLPTIVSRSQIIKSTNKPINQLTNKPEIEEFLKMSIGEKLALAEKIKDREKAIELVVNSVNFLHSQLHKNGVQYSSTVDKINKGKQKRLYSRANPSLGRT